MRLAIAGVGNNASALTQGIAFYAGAGRERLPGVARPSIGGIHVADIETVAAFDIAVSKVGRPLREAIFAEPNNYPDLGVADAVGGALVARGLEHPGDQREHSDVVAHLRDADAEVLLYSLPTGRPAVARAYGEAALEAGVAVVNCTPDPMARDPELASTARERGVPLVGDDLQSHLGSSVVHGALLALCEQRGVGLAGSYQVNLGGNADFANLRVNHEGKESSKHNALRQRVTDTDRVRIVPAAAHLPYLEDRKVAHISVEGRGWADMPIRLDVMLQVQDSSNAAGVIVDLIRLAATARGRGEGGFPHAAAPLLKSPPVEGDPQLYAERARQLLAEMEHEA